MKNTFVHVLGASIALTILICGCSDGGGGSGSTSGNSSGGGGGNTPTSTKLLEINIQPNNSTIGINSKQQFKAIASYGDPKTGIATRDVTSQVVWSSSDTSVASITPSGGLVTSMGINGNTNITAKLNNISNTTPLHVVSVGIYSKNSQPRSYSMPANGTKSITFTVTNFTNNTYTFPSQPTITANIGTAILNTTSSTCKQQLAANTSCDYNVTYSSPDLNSAGKFADIIITLPTSDTNSETTQLQASKSIFIADGTAKLALPQIPTKVLVIYNDDPTHTLYPVIETSLKLEGNEDLWIMSYVFQGGDPIYIRDIYRIYVGGQNGIAPGKYAMVALPLYLNLSDPSTPDKYIDWWKGTRVYLYDNPLPNIRRGYDDTQVNTNSYSYIPKTRVCYADIYNQPSCDSVPTNIYKDNGRTSFPANDPDQNVEFTLGDNGGGMYTDRWSGTNVDYDISFVDNMYLIATVGKVDYSDGTLGWIGSDYSISELQYLMQNSRFMSLSNPVAGIWPEYVYSQKAFNALQQANISDQIKIPSAYGAVADITGGFPVGFDNKEKPVNGIMHELNREVDKKQWLNSGTGAIHVWDFKQKIISAWTSAITNNKDAQIIWSGFQDNYKVNCPNSGNVSMEFALPYMIGFVPINKCADGKPAGATPLPKANTDAGKKLINAYHELMNDSNQQVNPWVNFVHNELGLKYVYSYSIDDAVGNVQTSGDGFVIDVGGTSGLENPNKKSLDKQTILLNIPIQPANYAITGGTVCGIPVVGQTTALSPQIPLVFPNIPIYLEQVSGSASCNINFNVTSVKDPTKKYTVSIVLSGITKDTTVDQLQSIIKSQCKETVPGNFPGDPYFCRDGMIKAANTNTDFLLTIGFPG